MTEPPDHSALSEHQQRALAHVLDEIIPPREDGRLPGAGALGLAAPIAAALGKTPELLRMIVQGVSALDDLARKHGATAFAALPRAERVDLIDQLAASEHAFPPILLLHTYAAYYQHPRVAAALGLEPRPPHPKGYEMAADDFTLLEPVRQRGTLYRQ